MTTTTKTKAVVCHLKKILTKGEVVFASKLAVLVDKNFLGSCPIGRTNDGEGWVINQHYGDFTGPQTTLEEWELDVLYGEGLVSLSYGGRDSDGEFFSIETSPNALLDIIETDGKPNFNVRIDFNEDGSEIQHEDSEISAALADFVFGGVELPPYCKNILFFILQDKELVEITPKNDGVLPTGFVRVAVRGSL